MKISLQPLYSQLNAGVGACPLGCEQVCLVHQQAPTLPLTPGASCPLSLHQAQTCAEVLLGDAEVIFNKTATGDGKSLAAYLPGFLRPGFRIMGLYPTIELVADQEKQIKGDTERSIPLQGYCQKFGVAATVVDTLYGAELARRVAQTVEQGVEQGVEQATKGNKFKALWDSLTLRQIILTNPDIFHFITHFRYQNPAYNRDKLPIALACYPDLYVADEFHIFGVHQETAIINSLLLIRSIRAKKRPLKAIFTSATPKPEFIQQLSKAGFRVKTITGSYVHQETPGYRQILQPVSLEFVQLAQETEALTWLVEQAEMIVKTLETEGKGRGLIILNSVAQVGRVVRKLQELFPETRVKVREISGRIDRQARAITQQELAKAEASVLVVGTSAVDVGVDFRLHLLIFETSDAATFMQRLGRLGRHPGFSSYNAFALLPSRTPWVYHRLREDLTEILNLGEAIDRSSFQEIIANAFDPLREYEQYRTYWGALQAQGMIQSMSVGQNKEKRQVMQPVQEKIAESLRLVYGSQLDQKRGHWFALGQDPDKTGVAVQQELLRFRGGSDLQGAVWDDCHFYTYDLLRLLPYAEVEILDRETFLREAQRFNHGATEFDDSPTERLSQRYLQVYLKIKRWRDQYEPIGLECDRGTDELKQCTLTLLTKTTIVGNYIPREVERCLRQQKLLSFLVPVNRKQSNSHWEVSKTLHLSPMFGLYRLTDADNQAYACAFNQDALLLEALKWRLKPCEKSQPYIY